MSIIEHGLGLNITVISYCDSLDFGLTAAKNAVPDVYLLAQMLNQSYEELLHAQAATPVTAESVKPNRGTAKQAKHKPRQTKTVPTS